jgi:hypothetical protein
MPRSILDHFDVSLDFFTQVVLSNPSLRGMILGYIAEAKLKETLMGHGRGSAFRKDDDHDRGKKGDLVVTYEGFEFKIEVKSLQTNTVEMLPPGGEWIRKIIKQKGPGPPNPPYLPLWEKHRFDAQFRGQFQCDASDRRKVNFPDGSWVETTNLLFGEFHILAAGIFTFREKWDFGFALNRDLPASTNSDYTAYQRQRLIASMIPITWPLQSPFVSDIYILLDKLVAEEKAKQEGRLAGTETVVVEQPPVKTPEGVEEPQVKVVEKKRKKRC